MSDPTDRAAARFMEPLGFIQIPSDDGHCATCAHFRPADKDYVTPGWGDCRRITDDGPYYRSRSANRADVLAQAWDYEGYSAGLYVHRDFGCVHWEQAKEAEGS
jgi:hypothetical protein